MSKTKEFIKITDALSKICTILLENKKNEVKEFDNLDKKLLDGVKTYFNSSLTKEQIIIFSCIYYYQIEKNSSNVNIINICSLLNITYLESLSYKADFDYLYKNNIIDIDESDDENSPLKDSTFNIPKDIVKNIILNEPFTKAIKNNNNIYDFVDDVYKETKLNGGFNSIFGNGSVGSSEDRTDKISKKIKKLERKYDDIEIVKYCTDKIENALFRFIFYRTCYNFINSLSPTFEDLVNEIYNRIYDKNYLMNDFSQRNNDLFNLELIDIDTQSAYIGDSFLELSENAKNQFFGADLKLFTNKKTDKSSNYIVPEKITEKRLFFDDNLNEKLTFLQNSINNDNFKNLQERMKASGMPSGLSCIFYGHPGTGKTEAVYQIAKATGRGIIHVDISQSKSMWFGESEKKIKAIFSDYRNLCKRSEVKPILLFNEADGIFGKRKEIGSSSVDQTENAMQNIILEELERLDGILIATTNLNENLDKAFERRFLFKIKFEKPTNEIRQKIWQDKLNWLNESDCDKLIEYSFSGGEIDNIVRKAIMNEVLSGERPDIEKIVSYAKEERFTSNNFKIGF